ncbi:hypothetical protein [Thalassotalea agarivorans]|uniref:Phage shock protein B n=1 Tax=Thalassotalea agarivorans TaxID=349064 RepID=A0A1H9YMN4_THASX|nr:hypothetical protein [Thalassotalea agarivorans]SES69873.1 hypothetical protein SAMN05660429_00267 [Thalassotalea agarivorans]
MSGTTMVVIIVLISVGFGVMYDMYKKHLEFKEKTLGVNEKEQELKDEIAALNKRIEVLEKIVTDDGYQLKNEIDQL